MAKWSMVSKTACENTKRRALPLENHSSKHSREGEERVKRVEGKKGESDEEGGGREREREEEKGGKQW